MAHEYDIALKLLLQASTDSIHRQVTGVTVARWLNPELPEVITSRADLLGVTADAKLVHVELQSSHDSTMALRMAEYALRIYRQFGQFPKQIVLYVGEAPVRIINSWREPELGSPDFMFRFALLDAKDLDGAALLASSHIEDNLLAILTRLQDQTTTVRKILERITQLEEPARRAALARFLIISGLRRLAPTIKKEAQTMPILNDIMDHEVIGPAIRQGLEQGREQGLQQGLQEGLQQGREQGREQGRQEALRETVRRQLEKRFGELPARVENRLVNMPASELDEIAIQFVDAARLDDLFPK